MLVPELYQVKSIRHDTSDVFTLTLEKQNSEPAPPFLPGQFNMLYHFGFGEVAISISGNPDLSEGSAHTLRAVGSTTNAMQNLKPGDEIGVRGPFGTHWPMDKKGCDVLIIAGGLGICPLRPLLCHMTQNMQQYKSITLLYGAKTPQDILYKKDLENWKELGLNVRVTVDKADENWQGDVGVVTHLIKSHLPHPENTLILICGPEIMMQFAIKELVTEPINDAMVYLSLERNMQCGVGFCGHCQFGPYFVCKDGPVFSYSQIKDLFPIEEL
jgi:NAD(P)H-flavin reductase